jgi:hypothetical protein
MESIADKALKATIQHQNAFVSSSSLGWLYNRSVSIASTLYPLAVDARGTSSSEATLTSLLAAIEVDVFEVEGVDVAGDVSADWTSAVVGGMWEAGLKLV